MGTPFLCSLLCTVNFAVLNPTLPPVPVEQAAAVGNSNLLCLVERHPQPRDINLQDGLGKCHWLCLQVLLFYPDGKRSSSAEGHPALNQGGHGGAVIAGPQPNFAPNDLNAPPQAAPANNQAPGGAAAPAVGAAQPVDNRGACSPRTSHTSLLWLSCKGSTTERLILCVCAYVTLSHTPSWSGLSVWELLQR